jgi:hypothetical protein
MQRESRKLVDLCNMLSLAAQKFTNCPSDLIIHGKDRLHGATYR